MIRGAQENIRNDTGSEFIANVIKEWCKKSETNTLYISSRVSTGSLKVSAPDYATSCCPARFYETRGGAIALRKMACGLQPSTIAKGKQPWSV